jgi:hypothetical protein
MKGITVQRMVVIAKFPKFGKSFIRVSTLENLPRCTADVGVATAESVLGIISNTMPPLDVCENNSHKIYITSFEDLSKATLSNSLRVLFALHFQSWIGGRIGG